MKRLLAVVVVATTVGLGAYALVSAPARQQMRTEA